MNYPKQGSDRKPRAAPNGGKGRPKGALNRSTVAVKDAIVMVADKLGGVDRMVDWVKEDAQNERLFWGTIYPRLLPLQVAGEGGGPVVFQHIVREIVDSV